MNKTVLTFAISLLALNLTAQPGKPVRLALVPETDEVFAACDVLTARLSGDGKLQLLERADIKRVYREQGRSAANGDDLKMGRLLGADGLLLLNVIRTPQSTNLLARLVAVKPGVVLTDGSFPWPLRDLKEWTDSVATGIGTFVPKLTLSANDAVALSLVNLRSAVQSANASELEQQLKLLAIQRLSRERQLFVLERQKMQLLDEEKTLKAENAAFWSGSYLLDGIVDQSGYSKDTVTINGRLTPPKGGAPLAFEVNGNRTNLTEVINRLALKVLALLKARSSVPEWNATAEATQYFEEAKWALRWGVVPEAQAAADSAWALGKRDQECATIRIKSYQSALSDIPIEGKVLIDAALVADEEKSDRDWLAGHIAEASKSGPVVMVERNQIGLSYTTLVSAPDPQMVDVSRHILALYYEFSRNAPEGLLQAGAKQSERRISAWRALGTEVLATVSRTLEYYYLCPQAQAPVADKLADLRALARTVADWLFQTPAVHDSYFIGDRVATHDELAHSIGEDGGGNANIFRCELRWGSLCQESPEDCIALYRQLMGSPVFCYLHTIFWSHRTQNSVEVDGAGHSFEPPRLVAWRAQDRDRIPSTWNNFVRELNASTNVLLQLEAKAIACTEAKSDAETGLAFTNFFAGLLAHQDALLNNNVEQFYLHWGADELVSIVTGGISSDAKESLRRVYYSQYCPKLDALEREYWIKTVPAKRFLGAFEKQKQYLKENRPYDFFEFAHTFESQNYTTNQALEILPLVLAYKSNLVARSQGASGRQNGQMMGAISQVGFLENNIHRILNPPALPSPAQPKIQPPRVATAAKTLTTTPAAPKAPAAATNVINVTRFLPIPLDGLPGEQIAGVAITAHHWLEGKLVLDFQYGAFVYSFDNNGNWKSTSNVTFPAIAILDPVTEHWKVISCPAADSFPPNRFYHRTTLWRGEVFTSRGGQIKKFDEAKKVWQALEIAEVGDCELFTVNRHLYAATPSLLLEILDGGTSTRLLASNRRQPPVSTLDTQDLGTPTLFAGPGQSLRAAVGSNIVAWTNGDWHPVCSAPRAPKPPVISEDGVLFLADG